MRMTSYSKASIPAFLALGAWLLTAIGIFLPWITVTFKICVFFVCTPNIDIYSSHSNFLQFLIPINISQLLPNLNQYVTSFVISHFFPTLNQYLTSLTRAAYLLLFSVLALLLTLLIFAAKSTGANPPHRASAALSLLFSLVGLAALYWTAQTLTLLHQHVNSVSTALGIGFWTICTGLTLVGILMLLQLLPSRP